MTIYHCPTGSLVNSVGVALFSGDIRNSRVFGNEIGIAATNDQTIANALVYRNSATGILIDGRQNVKVTAATVVAEGGRDRHCGRGGCRATPRSRAPSSKPMQALLCSSVKRRWTRPMRGFHSDYNSFHAGPGGALVHYTRPFVDLLDWQADVARYDLNSLGSTVLDPVAGKAMFENRATDDYALLGMAAGREDSAPPRARWRSRQAAARRGCRAGGRACGGCVDARRHRAGSVPATGKPPSRWPITWQSHGALSGEPVRIELWQDGPDGPAFLALIAAAAPDTGSYDWAPEDTAIAPGSHGLRIKLSHAAAPHVSDMSAEPFSVPEDTSDYFVAPSVHEGGTGDNRKHRPARGRTKAEPGEHAADLRPGDRRHASRRAGELRAHRPHPGFGRDPDLGFGIDTSFTLDGAGSPAVLFTPGAQLVRRARDRRGGRCGRHDAQRLLDDRRHARRLSCIPDRMISS